jgi:hypothetical protein
LARDYADMLLQKVGEFFHELAAGSRRQLGYLRSAPLNPLYHLWSNPPRRAFATETIIFASRESFAVRITLSSLAGILALHLGHVLLL